MRLVILQTKPHEFPAAVELDLTAAEEAEAVVSIGEEVAELAEHRLQTQMAPAIRKMPKHQFLLLNQVHGILLLRTLRLMLRHGILRSLLRKALVVGDLTLPRPHRRLPQTLHQASFQRVSRRAGPACLRSLPQHQPQRKHPSQLRSMNASLPPPIVFF